MKNYVFPMKPVRIYPGPTADRLLNDPKWVIETKYDGCRAMVYVGSDGTIEVWNRHERIIPESRIPDIYAELRRLPLPPGTVLDGEVYPRGVVATATPAPGVYKLALFDIMQVRGSLDARQARLRAILESVSLSRVHFVEQAEVDKRQFLARAMADPLCEGVVLKQRDSGRVDNPKRSVESPVWLKIRKPDKAKA